MDAPRWTGQPAFWQGVACHQTPDDLWNLAELVWQARPADVIEVGPGDGGTSQFLRTLVPVVRSVDRGDPVPTGIAEACVLLDGDVYSMGSVLADLETYSAMARWLVVCHTIRYDWGSRPALSAWLPAHPEWLPLEPGHRTQHTWLIRT